MPQRNWTEKNERTKKCSISSKNHSLLAGKIFDDKGNYISPSHSNTRNRIYRYYISQAYLQSRKNEAGSVSKIPAGETESFVQNEIKFFLENTKNIQQYIENYDLDKQKDLLLCLNNLLINTENKIDNIFIRTILSKRSSEKFFIQLTVLALNVTLQYKSSLHCFQWNIHNLYSIHDSY